MDISVISNQLDEMKQHMASLQVNIGGLNEQAASLQRKIDSMEVMISNLSKCVRDEAAAAVLPKATDSHVPPPPPAAQRRSSTPPLAVLSYDEAFEAGGGVTALKTGAAVSRAVQHQTIDPRLEAELLDLFPVNSVKRGYSTVLVNQHFVSDFAQLYERARKNLSAFATLVNQLAQSTGARALVAPLKSAERACAKSAFKYHDGNGVAWYRLTDLIRGTLAYQDLTSMYVGLDEVAKAFKIREFNDRYQSPMSGGYRDLQLVVEVDGHLCELQLNTEAMLRAKETTGHRDYELMRELEAAVIAGDLNSCLHAFKWAEANLGSMRQTDVLNSREGSKLLLRACADDHVEIAVCLLEHKCDPNSRDPNGDTSLHLAMRGGHERTVWALLDSAGVDVKILNNKGQTALLVGYLAFRARPEERKARALSTLAHFSGLDYVVSARKLVDEEIKKARFNSSHLVDFAQEGRIDKMSDELQNFADPNSSRGNMTALVAAAQGGQLKAVELLLDYKPDPNVMQAALVAAASGAKWNIFNALSLRVVPTPESATAIAEHADRFGELQVLKQMLQYNISEAVRDEVITRNAMQGKWDRFHLMIGGKVSSTFFHKILEYAEAQGRVKEGEVMLSYMGPRFFKKDDPIPTNIDLFEQVLANEHFSGDVNSFPMATLRHTAAIVKLIQSKRVFTEMTILWKETDESNIEMFDLMGEALATSKVAYLRIQFDNGSTRIPVAGLQRNVPCTFRFNGSDSCGRVIGSLLTTLGRSLQAQCKTLPDKVTVTCFNDLKDLVNRCNVAGSGDAVISLIAFVADA